MGGAGADVLTGGAGVDVFRFDTPADGRDTITDFVSGTDQLAFRCSGVPFIAPGLLEPALFASNSAEQGLRGGFVYDGATGILGYDADGAGAGAAVEIVALGVGQALQASDILRLG